MQLLKAIDKKLMNFKIWDKIDKIAKDCNRLYS